MIRPAAAALLLLSLPAAAYGQPASPAEGASGVSDTPAPSGDDDADDDPTIVVTGEKEPKEKLVCESREETGSLFRKRICRTRAQVEEDEHNARRLADTFRTDQARRRQTGEMVRQEK
jgi:hypothetical protein